MTKVKWILSSIIGIASLITEVPSLTYADDCEELCPCESFGSFYTGLSLDFTGTYFSEQRSLNGFDPTSGIFPAPSLINITKSKSGGHEQPFGTFLLGFETRYWCRFNLGVEAFVSAAPKYQTLTGTDLNHAPSIELDTALETWDDLYMNTIFGVALMPGYQICPDVSIYGRVGYSNARARFHSRSNSVGTVSAIGTTEPLDTYDVSKHKNLNAFQAGVGFKIRVSDHVQLRLGYNWSDYNSIKLRVRTDDPSTGAFLIREAKRNPEQESFCASILYYFTPPEPYEACNDTCSCHEFYAGIAAIRDNSFISELDHAANARPAQFQDFHNALSTTTLATKGWGYEAFGGYGHTFSCGAYLGLEGFYNNSPSSFRASSVDTLPADVISSQAGTTTTFTSHIKLKDSYGIALLPGYKLNDHLLLFVKLGAAKRRLHVKTDLTGNPPPLERNVLANRRDQTKDIYGYQLGLGFDLRLCENIFLRNEYTLTRYSKVKYPRITSPLLSRRGFFLAGDASFETVSGEYKIGLVYKFPVCR